MVILLNMQNFIFLFKKKKKKKKDSRLGARIKNFLNLTISFFSVRQTYIWKRFSCCRVKTP